MDAVVTNILTNAVHASFLILYWAFAYYFLRLHRYKFTPLIVGFFFLCALLKIYGTLLHYSPVLYHSSSAWFALALLSFLLNIVILESLDMKESLKIICIILSLVMIWLGAPLYKNFATIAIPILLISLVAAVHLKGLARLGFLLSVASNLTWIAMRFLGTYFYGDTLPASLRFDNDIYHVMLVVSTFFIFKGAMRGDWKLTKSGH